MVRISGVLQSVMRAIRVQKWGGPEVLQLEAKVPIPTPGDNEVLLKVHATGVNPVDTYIRSGNYARLPSLPYSPGSDAAGVVEAVGKDVKNFKKGDRAYSVRSVSGAYAEYATSEALYTGHLAGKLSFSQGAALGVPYYTAYRALMQKGKARPGETVLIHGASGAVGMSAVQIARAQGLRVLGTAGTPEGLKLVKSLGASDVFNHREEGYIANIVAATGGEGPNIILEMLSNANLQKDLEMIKFQGRIVVIGCRGAIEINPRLLMGKESQVLGIMLAASTPDEWREMHALLEAGGETGWVQPHVGKEYKLEDVAKAHNDVINCAGACGKLVLTV
ncbi:quinone oxidoreductase-like isoform X1 [Littorina saxatilis]|uniref:Enoyl reductase (ER) domain-containing protein n=2 Tax=Littorina saxatilis TaxID=31220 RepID=A0AAN9AXC8_9CAEN